jgi:hypothetical protein
MWRHKAEMVSRPQQSIVEQMASAKAAAAPIGENIIRELPVIFMPRVDARADPEIWLHKAEMMSCRQPRQPIAEEIRSRHS